MICVHGSPLHEDTYIVEDDDALSAVLRAKRAWIARMFRQSMGETPHQFVRRHRVERAKTILRAPYSRVLDVAVACGFKTQQHFAQTFRDVCGLTPTEYRQAFWTPQLSGAS